MAVARTQSKGGEQPWLLAISAAGDLHPASAECVRAIERALPPTTFRIKPSLLAELGAACAREEAARFATWSAAAALERLGAAAMGARGAAGERRGARGESSASDADAERASWVSGFVDEQAAALEAGAARGSGGDAVAARASVVTRTPSPWPEPARSSERAGCVGEGRVRQRAA